MCGIVAAAAARNIVPVLVEGLKKLEYRGYDSAGLAVIGQDGIERVRSVGRVAELETAFAGEDLLALSRTDVAFHQAIAEAAHNVLFAHLSASLLTMLKVHVRDNIANLFAVAPVSAQLLAQHRAIWRAIQARDPAAARAAAEAHIDFVDDTLNAMQAKQGRGGVCWSGGRCSEISGKAQKGAGRESAHVALEK